MKRLNRPFILMAVGLLPLVLSSCIGPCGVGLWPGGSSASTALPASKYAAAEVVYRYFLPGGQWPETKTNFVYCLSFGVEGDEMPADFLARFAGDGYRFIPGYASTESRPGLILDAKTGRPVATLELQSLSMYNGRASAHFGYSTGSIYATEILRLSQQNGRWKVTQIKEKERMYK